MKFWITTGLCFLIPLSLLWSQNGFDASPALLDIPESLQFEGESQAIGGFFDDFPFRFGVEAAYTFSIPLGSARSGMLSALEDFEMAANQTGNFEGQILPRHHYQFGFFTEFMQTDRRYFGAGVRFTQRGYNVRIEGEEHHEVYQIDHFYVHEERFRLSTVEVPLYAVLWMGENTAFQTGLILGFANAEKAKLDFSYNQDTYINTELSDTHSDLIADDALDLSESVRNPYLGFFFNLDLPVGEQLYISLGSQYSWNYALLEYGKLSDFTASLGLKYRLPAFD